MRELDPLVSRSPIEKAGPAHVATLKTFAPPLAALDGRRLRGIARAEGKNLLFPVEGDDDLVVRVHLMSAGRLRYLEPGARGRRRPMFRVRFGDGGELVLTEAGKKKRAGVWLVTEEQLEQDLAHLGPGRALARRGGARRDPARRAPAAAPPPPRPARDCGDRARARERDPPARTPLAVQGVDEPLGRGDRAARGRAATTTSRAPSNSASRGRATPSCTSSTTASESPARSAGRRLRASTSRSTRSTTARAARPAAGCSRTAGSRVY